MSILFKHEMNSNLRSLIIWSISVGAMGFICICLYSSMTEDMAALSESFSNMGAFSDAFGMSTLGIGTIAGYFATEVGVVHSLGSAMFAAITATTILSKEEDGNTGEFLYSLPVSRTKVILAKILSLIGLLVIFTIVAAAFYILGFVVIDTHPQWNLFYKFILSQFMMNVEIMLICVMFSSFVKKNMPGTGIGIVLFMYVFDLMGRVVPDLKDLIIIAPFGYCNATEIFAENSIRVSAYIWGIAVMIAATLFTFFKYTQKDMGS